jgi:S1-C subfamily serine protease
MKKIFLLFLAFLIAGCGKQAIIKDVQVDDVQALETNNRSKPIQFKKIVVKLDRGEHIGAWEGGVLCIPNGDLNWKAGKLTIDSDEFTEAFQDELNKYNFETVGDTNSLFEDPSTWKSEVLVAGLITDLKANICYPYSGFGNFSDSKGEAYIKVEWQIYSKLDRQVVHKVIAEGDGKNDEAMDGGDVIATLNAFSEAVKTLLNDQKFRQIVSKQGEQVSKSASISGENIVVKINKSKSLANTPTKDWAKGVVTIFAGTGHGSGFIISDNLIITNHHVAGNAENVTIKLNNEVEFIGTVLRSDAFLDVALIKTDVNLPFHFDLAINLPDVGSSVTAIGSPLYEDLSSTVSKGIVSAIRKDEKKILIQSDVNVRPGNSGGPLINDDGKVVGITVSGIGGGEVNQGLNFFIPIDDAVKKLKIIK